MSYAINNITNWKQNFMTKSVQNNNRTLGADFLSSESVVLFSGPAEYTNDKTKLVPIGLIQNIQVSQQKQIQQFFEIGSRKPIFVPGRTIVSGGISRILFDGPSLMYAMNLNGASDTGSNTASINPDTGWAPLQTLDAKYETPSDLNGLESLGGDALVKMKSETDELPAPGYFFINLQSSFFNKPTGLGFMLYDMEGNPYGGFYLENCYIQAHTFSLAAQQTVLVENVSFRASTVANINLSTM